MVSVLEASRERTSSSRLEVKAYGRVVDSATTDRCYSIGEVSGLTGLSAHTLRFYEKEGLLLEPVRRDAAGRRQFSEQDVDWLRVGVKLRATGMPLPDIRRYVELVRAGSGTVQERLLLLRAHQARVRAHLEDVQEVLATIEVKVATYARHVADGSADSLWVERPDCA